HRLADVGGRRIHPYSVLALLYGLLRVSHEEFFDAAPREARTDMATGWQDASCSLLLN
ncbi:unnamed protein product, partial [Phaeothamnion confervicola]